MRVYLLALSLCLLAACGGGAGGGNALIGTWKSDCMQVNEGGFKSQLATMQFTQDSIVSKVTSFTDNNCSQGSSLSPDQIFKYRLEGNNLLSLMIRV